jgi:hypothetical protein
LLYRSASVAVDADLVVAQPKLPSMREMPVTVALRSAA